MAEIGDYNAEDYKPLGSREPIPLGLYTAMIVASEVKPTNNNDGTRLSLDFQIVEGVHEGRHVFDNVNLRNKSEKAMEIGARQLSSICRAVGKLRISDSAELHNLPLQIRVRIRPPQNGYSAQNEITEYHLLGQAPPASAGNSAPPASAGHAVGAATGAAPAPQGGTATRTAPPWQRK